MILQRLVEYYDRLASEPGNGESLPKPGYSLQKISFCVVLTPEGKLQQFQSLLDAGDKKPFPRQLLVPGQSKPSGSGINPCFLWDKSAYMLGFKIEDTKPERTSESFEAFREKHLLLEPEIKSAAFSAVCTFLRNWSPKLNGPYTTELHEITGNFGVFRIANQGFVHDDPALTSWWVSHASVDSDGKVRGVCLVSGEEEVIARLHEPKIKGVRGAQAAGALLVSFNDQAYESLGKSQSYNAPVGISAVFKYANALNYLLRREDRHAYLGDATVVFWTERPNPIEEFISDLFKDGPPPVEDAPAEDRQHAERVRLFLSQLRQGHGSSNPLDADRNTRFYILGLSPNASRLSIRFWMDTSVAEMEERLRQHMEDIELVGRPGGEPLLLIKRITFATGRAETDPQGRLKGYDADSISPLLAGALARAVLTGGAYPNALLSAMVRRIRSDGVISYPRIAAIKGCLNRNSRLRGIPKEVPVALDVNRTEPAYVSGRLFALLEKIQEDSINGTLNATVKDRYFSAASATPGVVFPRLIRLSQYHLAKIEGGLKIHREKQLGEIMNKLDRFPSHLNLEDQGLFAVGYFHQRQDFFTKKDTKTKEGEIE